MRAAGGRRREGICEYSFAAPYLVPYLVAHMRGCARKKQISRCFFLVCCCSFGDKEGGGKKSDAHKLMC